MIQANPKVRVTRVPTLHHRLQRQLLLLHPKRPLRRALLRPRECPRAISLTWLEASEAEKQNTYIFLKFLVIFILVIISLILLGPNFAQRRRELGSESD